MRREADQIYLDLEGRLDSKGESSLQAAGSDWQLFVTGENKEAKIDRKEVEVMKMEYFMAFFTHLLLFVIDYGYYQDMGGDKYDKIYKIYLPTQYHCRCDGLFSPGLPEEVSIKNGECTTLTPIIGNKQEKSEKKYGKRYNIYSQYFRPYDRPFR